MKPEALIEEIKNHYDIYCFVRNPHEGQPDYLNDGIPTDFVSDGSAYYIIKKDDGLLIDTMRTNINECLDSKPHSWWLENPKANAVKVILKMEICEVCST